MIKWFSDSNTIDKVQQVSQKELGKMHKEHLAMVASNSGRVGVTGFPFISPH
jgi:hypothetical protein